MLDVGSHLADLERDGYTIVRNALSSPEVETTKAAIAEILPREEAIARRFGTQTDNLRGIHNVVAKHPRFAEFFLNPPALGVVRGILGDDAVVYDMNVRLLMPTGGREVRRGFQVHVDRQDYSVLPFRNGQHYPMAMNVTWCLVDFTRENGATLLWPGTHRSREVPEPESWPPGHVYAEAPAGSAVIWDAALWHASGRNHSQDIRWSILAFYQRAWIKGRNNMAGLLPPEVRTAISVDAQRVLGILPTPPDYSEVRALTPEQIAALSRAEKDVLGFPLYGEGSQ